jgi:hypothetical protein
MVLSGTLLRIGPEYWRWRDGVGEPRIGERGPTDWGCALVREQGTALVSVPRTLYGTVPPLRFVVEGWRTGRWQSASAHAPCAAQPGRLLCTVAWPGELPAPSTRAWLDASDPAPAAILVPLDAWNRWVATTPVGAAWDPEHDRVILGRAYALGWRPPNGYVSPTGWSVLPEMCQRD